MILSKASLLPLPGQFWPLFLNSFPSLNDFYFYDDLRERFAFPLPFSDVHGKLALSAKQRQKLSKWARPDEFIREPAMIQLGQSAHIQSEFIAV
jgi:hypothetical protein